MQSDRPGHVDCDVNVYWYPYGRVPTTKEFYVATVDLQVTPRRVCFATADQLRVQGTPRTAITGWEDNKASQSLAILDDGHFEKHIANGMKVCCPSHPDAHFP